MHNRFRQSCEQDFETSISSPQGVANHLLGVADEIDRLARKKLKAEGKVHYKTISKEELDAKEANREANRQAARELAGFMRKDDKPVPTFDFDDM